MRCKICRTKFTPRYFLQKWCSDECGAKYAVSLKDKADRQRTKEQKAKLKTYTQKVNEAKRVFQEWVRNRDAALPCISCGATDATFHGGHYKKAELYRGVIFHEQNCAKQCQKCNTYLNGNEANYRTGLVKKIGENAVIELERLADETRNRKYTDDELQSIKTKYKVDKTQ